MSPDSTDRLRELLERERETATLTAAVTRCSAGRGGAFVIEGPAGIGKTTLLGFARDQAAAAGVRVVSARGAELERSFPYGVVRQFFESFLFTVASDQRPGWLRRTEEMAAQMFGGGGGAGVEPAEEFALLHALYWMCVNIADERPLMMVLDDAQWADEPSLKFVEFACRRLEQLPFIFVVASRSPESSSPASLVALLADPSVERLHPAPLSATAVQAVVRERVASTADPEFAAACYEVTGGNPFLLRELIHEVLAEQLPATADAAARVRALGPRGIARVVLLRLRRLPEGARRLAAALSVAADGLRLADLGLLAGLDEQQTAAAAAGLEAAEIVELREDVRFTHPVVRTAVYEDLRAVERAELHLMTARLKAKQGRPVTEVAAPLLHTEPGDDSWVIETLRDAARRAMTAGDFGDAQRLLTRALAEHGGDALRPELLAELGAAEARTGDAAGAEHLREAAALTSDPVRGATIAIELATILKFSLQADEAADVLLDAVRRLRDPSSPLARRLYAELLGTRFISPVTHERIRDELATLGEPVGEPRDLLDAFLLAAEAFDAVAAVRPAAEAVALGRRALTGGAVPDDPARGGQALIVATIALIWAEDFTYVIDRLTRALGDEGASGSALALGNNSVMRAVCCYRAGRLLDAEADAAVVLRLAPDVEGLQTLLPPAVAYAVLAGIDRGVDVDSLRALAFNPALDQGHRLLPFTQLSWARGELCLMLEEWERALAHFNDCNRLDPGFGAGNPAMVPWREGAALAHLRLGETDVAVKLTAEAVHRAETFGAPRALGGALRAAALVREGEERVVGLRAAVDVLADAGSPLELARAGADLGAALRAAGRRTEALEVLGQTHEQAMSLGARRIAQRVAAELGVAGVRPRREIASGPSALTPSERRVAELAAAGKTNREIAQSLFVTEKTVETHLGHVYDKLGIRSRRKLANALGLVSV